MKWVDEAIRAAKEPKPKKPSRQYIPLRLPPTLVADLDELASELKRSRNATASYLLTEGVREYGKKKKEKK